MKDQVIFYSENKLHLRDDYFNMLLNIYDILKCRVFFSFIYFHLLFLVSRIVVVLQQHYYY